MPSEKGTVGSPKKEELLTVELLTCFKNKRKKRKFPIEDRKKTKEKKKGKFPIKDRKKTKEKESSRSKIRRKQKKKKIPNQRLEESKKERKDSWSKIGRKEICKKVFRPDNIRTNTDLSRENTKRKETMTWSGPLPLIVNQNPVRWRLFRPALNKNREKEQAEMPRAKFPTKNTIPEKALLSAELGWNTCLCEVHTLWVIFFYFCWTQCFLQMIIYEWNANTLNLICSFEKILSVGFLPQ